MPRESVSGSSSRHSDILVPRALGQELTTERNFHSPAQAHPQSSSRSSHREKCFAVPALEIHVARNLELPHLRRLETPEGVLECFGWVWKVCIIMIFCYLLCLVVPG